MQSHRALWPQYGYHGQERRVYLDNLWRLSDNVQGSNYCTPSSYEPTRRLELRMTIN